MPVGFSCAAGSTHTWVALWELEKLSRLRTLAEEAADRAEKIVEMRDIGIIIYD